MISPPFDHTFFAHNRAELLRRSGLGLIVIAGAGQMQRSADLSYPFHQDRNFWYLCGLEAPDLTLVISADKCYVISPSRSRAQLAFDGEGVSASALHTAGISDTYDSRSGWEELGRLASKESKIGVLPRPPEYIKSYSMYTNPARRRLHARLRRRFPDKVLESVTPHLACQRMVKQPSELVAIQNAIDITSEALASVRQALPMLDKEREVEALFSERFRNLGAKGHAFDPIVASGANATTIHYLENSGPLVDGGLIICDIGAEAHNYSADLARTFAKAKPTARQRDVYDAVLHVQNYALDLLGPGMQLKHYEETVRQEMGRQLVKLGLLTSSSDHDKAWRYYPHAASHHLGLDAHDAAEYATPLAENMVVTCEPGIYIVEEGIGVRIEDDILITTEGNTVMSQFSREL